MTWQASATGDYHQVVGQIKGAKPEGDDLAAEHGHIQAAKDAALAIVDTQKESGSTFAVSLFGHTSTKRSYQIGTNVTVTQNTPEED